jgi:hypothetical protein
MFIKLFFRPFKRNDPSISATRKTAEKIVLYDISRTLIQPVLSTDIFGKSEFSSTA